MEICWFFGAVMSHVASHRGLTPYPFIRVAKGSPVTRDGTQIISVMRDCSQIGRVRRDWHSSVMRDVLFSQRVTLDFRLKFP